MSAPVTVSSAYIAGQQSDLAATLAVLERRAQDLAFAAVSGDEEAVAELASVNAEIERAKADALVLDRARATADRLEAQVKQAARRSRQAKHRAEAARQAVAFADLVQEADAAIDAFQSLNSRIAAAEQALRQEARAAGINPDTGVFGRSGAAAMVLGRMSIATGWAHGFRDNPPVSGRVRTAWAFLSEPQAEA